jgi:hypothetical protein
MFEYQHHERTDRNSLGGAPKVIDAANDLQKNNFWSRFNQKVGLKITLAVGTMWCAYIFGLMALLSLPSAISSGNIVILVAWASSNFLQLVLLPIIIVGQNIQAKAADLRSEATYKDAEAVLHEAQQIQQHLLEQDKYIEHIVKNIGNTNEN